MKGWRFYWLMAAICIPGICRAAYEPPSEVKVEEIVRISNEIIAKPDVKVKSREDIFRIRVHEMDWDIGVMVYEPEDSSNIPVGPDGKKVGVFLLHGGMSDCRDMEQLAFMLSRKFGYKVTSMTYPGRLYFNDPSRNWAGDTIHPDGSVRMPIWKMGEEITRDQYEVIWDESKRERYGRVPLAKAKPGSLFYNRMASWPVAFEEAMKEVCSRHFPAKDFSIYTHGHSTGGPYVHYLNQRVSNIVGGIGIENSPFGYIFSKMIGQVWDTWDSLRILTWRSRARYMGAEILKKEGPDALNHLPRLMEDVFDRWDKEKMGPYFKAEDIVQFNGVKPLEESAKAAAKRLNLGPRETEDLVKRYVGYTRELSGPGVKRVPPLFLGIVKGSADHTPERYQKILLPMFSAMKPAPKVRVVQFQAGIHGYTVAEKDLPLGVAPAVVKLWHDAIMGGYFLGQ